LRGLACPFFFCNLPPPFAIPWPCSPQDVFYVRLLQCTRWRGGTVRFFPPLSSFHLAHPPAVTPVSLLATPSFFPPPCSPISFLRFTGVFHPAHIGADKLVELSALFLPFFFPSYVSPFREHSCKSPSTTLLFPLSVFWFPLSWTDVEKTPLFFSSSSLCFLSFFFFLQVFLLHVGNLPCTPLTFFCFLPFG